MVCTIHHLNIKANVHINLLPDHEGGISCRLLGLVPGPALVVLMGQRLRLENRLGKS